MTFVEVDSVAVSRALAAVAHREEDLAEAYLERLETVELPADGEPPGIRVRREEGLAVRLLRDGRSWSASRDALRADALLDALRQVTRVHPRAMPPLPESALAPAAEDPLQLPSSMTSFSSRLARRVRELRFGFPLRTTVRRHRRSLLVVGQQVAAAEQSEAFYSCRVELPGGNVGLLSPSLDEEVTASLAARLGARFQARGTAPLAPSRSDVVLGPAAAAVFLHEAVAHALEADTVARSGRPEAAIGLPLGPSWLHVLDDPGAAPEPLRRSTDDEGAPVVARWLLRSGVVEQLLADRDWSRRAPRLAPGAGRRADRHHRPGPRSTHLVLVPDPSGPPSLVGHVERGLWVGEAERGSLDPLTGRFTLRFPYARRIDNGQVGEPIGPGAIGGGVADLLARLAAVGGRSVAAGAGWCAKGGQRLPVWASSPDLLLAGVEVGG